MARPVRLLRETLEQFLAGEEAARLARLRDPSDDVEPASRSRGRWLASSEASEAFEEARESGELAADELLWLERHLALARHALGALHVEADLRRRLAAARLASDRQLDLPERLARLARTDDAHAGAAGARELEHALRPLALVNVAGHARAERPLLVRRAPAESPRPGSGLIVSAFSPEAMAEQAAPELPDEPWLAYAASFLVQTQSAADEAVTRCAAKIGGARPLPWHVLLRGLRAPDLDSSSGARQRWRRAAAWLRGLGFERELNSRVRAETDRGGALPLAQVLARGLPHDVRVAQSMTDWGVASDVFAAEGLGRALGLSLVHAALPCELRWPAGASSAGALGALALQLWGHPLHLIRVQELSESAARRVGELAGTLALLYARFWAALAILPLADAGKPEARLEALAEGLSRALCCDLPEGVAGMLGADRVAARSRAHEALAGLALHLGLREQFDDDWFRNPRSEELLRGGCAPGNRLTPEQLCAELRVGLDAAPARANELVT